MKKSFEYDLTKYDPSAPKKTEEFLTADGVKTLTTDANDGAVLIQDEVDEDSLNPVTGAAVAAAIEAGGGGGGSVEEVFIAKYNSTAWEDVLEAYTDGKVIFLEVTDTSIPYPYRMNSTAQIPLAAIRTGSVGACAVFIGSSLGTTEGTGENTSWPVYVLGTNDVWSTQVSKVYPRFTSSDFNKVLSIVDNGNNFPVLQWVTPQGGGSSYTAGDGIDITNSKIKVDLASNKGLEFASSTETTFTADYQGYDLGQWGYMGIGPLHKTSDGLWFQLDFRHTSENYLAWNVNNGSEYYIFAYDPQDSTKYAICSEPYFADINQSTIVAIGYAWGDGQYEHLYTADPGMWDFSGGLDPNDLDNAAFGIYFPNTVGSSPMGTDYAAIGETLLPNIGYTTTTIVPDTGKLQVKANENSGIHVDDSGVSVKVDNSTIQVNGSGELVANVSGGPSYSAGNGLSINGNMIAVEADLSTGLAFKPGFYESTTISGETSYRSFAFDREPLGHNISISFNNTGSNTTISSSASQNGATLRFALCDSDQGFGYHVMLLGTKDIVDADSGNAVVCTGTTQSVGRLVSDLNEDVFENEYVPYGDYSYGDWASVESICLVAYDSSEDVIVGDPIALLSSSAQFKAEGDFIVRPLTNLKALPSWDHSDPSTDAGKVLQVQSNGTLAWVTLT